MRIVSGITLPLQDEHVLATGAAVLLSVCLNLDQVANDSVVERRFEMEDARRETHLVRDRNFALQLFRQCKKFIGFGKRLRQWLFAEDVCARFERGANHGIMLICPARPHANKVGLLALEHYFVLRILAWSFGSLRSFGTSGLRCEAV